MMRKGKLCFILLFLVLFYWPNPAQSETDLFPTDSIGSITDLVLEQRGDKADVFFPEVPTGDFAGISCRGGIARCGGRQALLRRVRYVVSPLRVRRGNSRPFSELSAGITPCAPA